MALTREWVERKIIRLENAITMCKRDGLAFTEQAKLAELCRHWLATQPAESELQSCKEANGCPTELAVLQRFWIAHQNCMPIEVHASTRDLDKKGTIP